MGFIFLLDMSIEFECIPKATTFSVFVKNIHGVDLMSIEFIILRTIRYIYNIVIYVIIRPMR